MDVGKLNAGSKQVILLVFLTLTGMANATTISTSNTYEYINSIEENVKDRILSFILRNATEQEISSLNRFKNIDIISTKEVNDIKSIVFKSTNICMAGNPIGHN